VCEAISQASPLSLVPIIGLIDRVLQLASVFESGVTIEIEAICGAAPHNALSHEGPFQKGYWMFRGWDETEDLPGSN